MFNKVMHGVYSESQKKYGGSKLYHSITFKGETVEVTEVFDTEKQALNSKWKDRKYIGQVGELIGVVQEPKIVLWE